MKRLLFVCSQNKLRSPTAEAVFSKWEGVETSSCGLNHDAEIPASAELVEWADIIFVMEKGHRSKLSAKFKRHLGGKRLICLDIPDKFEYMDPELVALLQAKVAKHLPRT